MNEYEKAIKAFEGKMYAHQYEAYLHSMEKYSIEIATENFHTATLINGKVVLTRAEALKEETLNKLKDAFYE